MKFSSITAGAAGLALAVVTAAAAGATPAKPDDAVIPGSDRATAIAGSYIVTLKPGASGADLRAKADQLAAASGGRTGQVYGAALSGFELRGSQKAALRIRRDPAVAAVEQNQVVRLRGTQNNPPWGLDRIDQASLPLNSRYNYPNTASAVTAYVIDTGIRVSHSQFGGRATSGWDFVDNDADASDCHGHGTHVAGTIGGRTYGVAKAVQLVAVRVLDCSGSGTLAGVIAGVNWVTATATHPAVANMSLGGDPSAALDQAVSASIATGITYAVAAGNSSTEACMQSPASVPGAITVAATDRRDNRADWSNYGTCVDIFAPGVDIRSAWASSDTANRLLSGTSMASPHVAGAAALMLAAHPLYTPAQVSALLVRQAASGKVVNPGTGSPNRLLKVGTGPASLPAPPCVASNGTDLQIPDAGAAVESTVVISGCVRAASAAAQVWIDLPHSYRGDLLLELIAPDGSRYRLRSNNIYDPLPNTPATYGVNLSSEPAPGTWKLRVKDSYGADTGMLDMWTLKL